MIDPILLEDLLLLRNEAFNKFSEFKKLISKKYKYLKIEKKEMLYYQWPCKWY